jgi:MFS transporter, DHA2 family, multidrug resistance protein
MAEPTISRAGAVEPIAGATSAAMAEGGLPGIKRWLALLATMLGLAVYMLTITLSGAALPHMQGTFSAAPDQMAWLLTSFVIGTTIVTACCGWIAMRIGRTRLYCIAAAGFTVASVLCGFSTSLEEALVYRTLQGMFGAPLSPMGQAIAVDSFPRRQQGMAVALWSMGGVLGTLIGPYAGGILVEEYGWPWVFYVNVPFGVLAFLAAAAFVPEIEKDRFRTFNWYGFTVLAIAITGVQIVLNRGERLDWFDSTEIVAAAAAAAACLYLFVLHLSYARQPFFDPSILADRNYAIGLTMVFIHGAIIYLQLFLMPVLLQSLAGYGVRDVGGMLAFRAAGIATGMIIVSVISDRVDTRLIFLAGFACLIASAWNMSGWTAEVRSFDASLAMFLNGMGSATSYVPLSLLAFSTLAERKRNEGMALFYVAQSLGTATGTAVIYNVLTRSMRVNHDAMSEVLTPYNELFKLGGMWNLSTPGGLAALDAEIGRQAAMVAYNNSFYLIAIIGLLLLPVAVFLRPPKRG